MEEKAPSPRVTMHVMRGCLIVPIQVELYNEIMLQVQQDILERIKETAVKGVIIDLSGVDLLDSFLAQAISDTARAVSMLGATTILTGLKPEVVASLIDLDIDFGDIQTAITLEEGFQKLEPLVEPKERLEEIEEPKEEDDKDRKGRADEDESEEIEEEDE